MESSNYVKIGALVIIVFLIYESVIFASESRINQTQTFSPELYIEKLREIQQQPLQVECNLPPIQVQCNCSCPPCTQTITTGTPTKITIQESAPKPTKSGKRLSIIIPFRNREEQLNIFSRHVSSLLDDQNLDYTIHVVDQIDTQSFNRGLLRNIGYELSKDEADYFVFHDVDEIPLDGVDYGYPATPVLQLSSEISRFKWTVPYAKNFGGVVMFQSKDVVESVGGYSNEYWSWGGEDDDMYYRLKHFGILNSNPPRPPPGKGKYLSITEGHTVREEKVDPLKALGAKWDNPTAKARVTEDGLSLMRKQQIFTEVERVTSRWWVRHKVTVNRTLIEEAAGIKASITQ